ncbi:DEAD/DEAH box helicase [Jannaschia pohangensis]|uniref:ATP-dependent RNA helicase DeaD n=1 Tax=Jannaschia pohangensis TaxID=390807 RepID=A0A1I3TAX1_9RHOB|nr:DEAD/DEAH box helicase [Jannaschia pohangensis]SFJ67770.1 ATP-dependent RNA helicase DeaD [Jannaschia pohangensis]
MKQAIAEALSERGYVTLTPVQDAVLEPGLEGADMLVSAQTGSGKTLGFGLAIAPTLLGDDEMFDQAGSPLALIIAPTRELALQVRRELTWLYAKAGADLASCVGGMDMRDERRALARGAHIVVATPGRLRDHIMRGSIDLTAIRAVVLDEADEMLDLGFREDLEFILGECPEDRQTLLFSATVPAAIAKLAESYQKDAVRVATVTGKTQHADIEYHALEVSARDSENAIINVLRFHEAPNAIVFCNTRAMVNRLTTRLSNRGFSVVALSGELSQAERTHALQAMRDGRARVCVATDVAARGIDLPNLDLVIHAELPTGSDTLLHRSGRTGRAGRKGVSALIVPPAAKKKAHRLLGWAKLSATWAPAPGADEVRAKDRERVLDDPAWHEEITEDESDVVNELAARFTPQQLAAAYLRLMATRQTAPEDLSEVVAGKPERRQEFGPSRWFAMVGGRKAHHDPRRLLPMLCKAGGLTRDDIGAIRIREDETFFQISEATAEAFTKSLGPAMEIEGEAVRPSDAPPAQGPRPAYRKPEGGNRPPRADKPAYDSAPPQADKPAYNAKSKGTTKPVEWNDDPAPRPKKPKVAHPNAKPRKPHQDRPEGVVEEFKRTPRPDGKPDRKPRTKTAGKPGAKPWAKPEGGKPGKPAPGKTPVGKPSSKKNRARAAEKKAAQKGPSKG